MLLEFVLLVLLKTFPIFEATIVRDSDCVQHCGTACATSNNSVLCQDVQFYCDCHKSSPRLRWHSIKIRRRRNAPPMLQSPFPPCPSLVPGGILPPTPPPSSGTPPPGMNTSGGGGMTPGTLPPLLPPPPPPCIPIYQPPPTFPPTTTITTADAAAPLSADERVHNCDKYCWRCPLYEKRPEYKYCNEAQAHCGCLSILRMPNPVLIFLIVASVLTLILVPLGLCYCYMVGRCCWNNRRKSHESEQPEIDHKLLAKMRLAKLKEGEAGQTAEVNEAR